MTRRAPNHPSLLSQLEPDTGWRTPESLPVLDDRFKRIGFDYETTGLDWLHDEPAGVSISLEDGRDFYFPTGHQGGGNLDKGLVKRWLRENLPGKTLCCSEAKFEVHMSRKWDLDLEAMGCKLREAQYKAALLDDQRMSFKLGDMMRDYLGREKVDLPHKRLAELPVYVAGPYAQADSRGHLDLDTELTRRIHEEDLGRVSDLEDALIYATCEMEKNGARLNVPKLETWRREILKLQADTTLEIYRRTGIRINPSSSPDMERLFRFLNLPYGRTEASEKFPEGQASFTDEFLRNVADQTVQQARLARNLASLDSKYFAKYLRSVDNEGVIRFKLHQLKGDEYGTISGRYSSSGFSAQKGLNIQQVFDPERQAKKMPYAANYIVRDLFIPDNGFVFGMADASQIEFRYFGHYSGSQRIIQAYRDNPYIDFHEAVAQLLKVDRKEGKGLNFGFIYCMGREKLARKLELPQEEADKLYDAYNEMFPEVRPLIYRAIDRARERGYVTTMLGRRARFPEGSERGIHSALNRVIQGTSADTLKLKTLQVYNNRKTLGIHKLRWTVHDELDGDFESHEHVHGPFRELLDEQVFSTKIPILWETKSGDTWANARKRLDNSQPMDTRSPNRWNASM
jgi:DNA polymerase-1